MTEIAKKLFDELNKSNILYCHFKSNEHLEPGLAGDTDLDVLVKKSQYVHMCAILIKLGYKKFEPLGVGGYPGVSNWFGFDFNTGKLVHVHLHTQLITGKGLVKDYVIPWGDIILENSIMHKASVKVTEPAMELILLFTRIVVKQRWTNDLKSISGFISIENDVWDEIHYLRNLITKERLEECCNIFFNEKLAEEYIEIILKSERIRSTTFRGFKKYIRKQLKQYRRMDGKTASVLSFFRKCIRRWSILSNRYFHSTYNEKKRPADRNGISVAFVGIDGSGKSTLLQEILSWLGEEFDVKKYYMGAGDGAKSILVQLPIVIYQKFFSRKDNFYKKKQSEIKNDGRKSEMPSLLKALGASYTYSKLATDNYKKIICSLRYCENGGISLYDRFPQSEIEVMHDGMKVQRYCLNSNKKVLQYFGKKEKQVFNNLDNRINIDLVLRLVVDPEIAYSRKDEDEINCESRRIKAKTLRKIHFRNARKIIDINANANFDQVLLDVKRVIWENL